MSPSWPTFQKTSSRYVFALIYGTFRNVRVVAREAQGGRVGGLWGRSTSRAPALGRGDGARDTDRRRLAPSVGGIDGRRRCGHGGRLHRDATRGAARMRGQVPTAHRGQCLGAVVDFLAVTMRCIFFWLWDRRVRVVYCLISTYVVCYCRSSAFMFLCSHCLLFASSLRPHTFTYTSLQCQQQ